MIAEILIDSKAKELDKTFSYKIPEEMLEKIQIGSRVLVPFGRGKKIEEGYVIKIKEKSEYATKQIIKIEKQSLTKENIELAEFMSKRYFCNLSDCIKQMLPPGTKTKQMKNRVKEKMANYVELKKEPEEIEKELTNNKIKSEKQNRK